VTAGVLVVSYGLGRLLGAPDGFAGCALMVRVPAGWFVMGANEGRASNQPAHAVYVSAFCIDRTEVTQATYAWFASATGRTMPDEPFDPAQSPIPARGVVWEDAQAYCAWVGKRLPTEAEWEKAARGVDGRRYPWGEPWRAVCANTRETGLGTVLPVGSFATCASPCGALDMAGNVTEWVADVYDPRYYRVSPDQDPTGPILAMDHVLRGGSYATSRDYAQTFVRNSSHSVLPNPRVGLRCAADAL
jgi:formylglycine-generating enzyme required for sulfatase activity